MKCFHKGRELYAEVCYEASACDSFVESGYYIDDGTEVPADVIELLTDAYAAEVYEAWFEHQIGRAEFYEQD